MKEDIGEQILRKLDLLEEIIKENGKKLKTSSSCGNWTVWKVEKTSRRRK